MKRSCLVLSLVSLATMLFATCAQAQFTYTFYPNDTTINTDVNTDIAIVGYTAGTYNPDFTRNFTGPASPTVQITDGANITSELDTFNNSIVNITGGNEAFLVAYDNSTINVSGGSFIFMLNEDNAIINMSGGYVSDLEGQGKAIHISGGMIDTLVANVNTDFFGNNLGNCVVDVTGGTIGGVQSFNEGVLNIRGGTIGGDWLAAFGGAINVYGTDLRATLLDANHVVGGGSIYSLYALSGVLEDGTVVTDQNLLVRHDAPGVDGSLGQSSFRLIFTAPEPCSLAFVFVAGMPLVAAVLRRRYA